MAAKREFVVILVVSCLFCAAYSNEIGSFWLVLQWPPSVCPLKEKDSKCSSSLGRFVIYGFWPQYSDGDANNYPKDCNGPPYDKNSITRLVPLLKEYWPNLLGEDELAWQRAWLGHGTCSSSKFNQQQYFQTALALAQEHDLVAILKQAGIVPGQTEVSKAAAEQVIASRVGALPGFRCKITPNRFAKLVQIRLCFAIDGKTPIKCPTYASGGCPDVFSWPTPFAGSRLALPQDYLYY